MVKKTRVHYTWIGGRKEEREEKETEGRKSENVSMRH